MSFRKRTLIIPKRPIILKPLSYTSLTDSFLNNPNGLLNQNQCFIPVGSVEEPSLDSFCRISYSVGSDKKQWYAQWPDGSCPEPQSIYGVEDPVLEDDLGLVLYNVLNDGGINCPSSDYDGLQRIYLPRISTNDKLGGYIEFYYNHDAIVYANGLVTGLKSIEIAHNGSLYFDTVKDENLIIRWDGKTGPKGDASPDVTEDIQRIVN